MPKVLPRDPLPAESLQPLYLGAYNGVGALLTLRMWSRSLVMYTRTSVIATRRPLYVPCDTSAKPPDSTSTESSEQSGTCMDVGITRCRLHVLQSLLSNFTRSRSDMAPFSSRCNLRQPFMSAFGDVERLTSFISLTRLWVSDSEPCRNWKKEATRGRIFPDCCRWLGGKNTRCITESLHRCFGSTCQPLVITFQTRSSNNRPLLPSIGRGGCSPVEIRVIMSFPLIP